MEDRLDLVLIKDTQTLRYGCLLWVSWRWNVLTHWSRVTHICVSKLIIIPPDNGLSPGQRQAIIGTNAGIMLIWTVGTNFSEILSEIRTFSFKKTYLNMSSAKWRPFCLGLNVLMHLPLDKMVAISQKTFSNAVFINENFCVLIPISLKFIPKGPIDNKSSLVQVMAWCQTGNKPLSEPMMTQFTDTYMWHTGPFCW